MVGSIINNKKLLPVVWTILTLSLRCDYSVVMVGRIIDNKGSIAIGGDGQQIYQEGGCSCGYI